jgi:hypothetical protein
MKYRFKLFAAIVACGLVLTGCGGGGGSDGGGGNNAPLLSLAKISSAFPDFNYGYTLNYITSNKEYNASAAKIADFNTSVIQTQGYDYASGVYKLSNVLPNISAAVILNSSIDLYLVGTDNFDEVLKDENFESVFGNIDGDIAYVYVHKEYLEDISSKFDDYAASVLSPSGFNCTFSNSVWQCYKNDPDAGIRYTWFTVDDYSYGYHIYPL